MRATTSRTFLPPSLPSPPPPPLIPPSFDPYIFFYLAFMEQVTSTNRARLMSTYIGIILIWHMHAAKLFFSLKRNNSNRHTIL